MRVTVAIDNYIDPEQFLIAAYETYDTYCCASLASYSDNMNQLAVLATRVIGLAQSLISPEIAKIYCHPHVFFEYLQNRTLSFDQRALEMKSGDGSSFYRVSRNSRSGFGFDSLCSIYDLTLLAAKRSLSGGPLVIRPLHFVGGGDQPTLFCLKLIGYIEQERRSLASLCCEYQARRDMVLRR